MKKKLLIVLAVTMIALAFASCGKKTEDPATTLPADGGTSSGNGNAASDKYVFQYKGTSVSVDDAMQPIIDALGEPANYFEAASCAFNGLDKTYTYYGFEIMTRPDNDKDFVLTILLTDDTVSTAEGISIGSSADAVKSAYGAECVANDANYVCTRGQSEITFIVEKDKVTSIKYSAKQG